MISAFKRLVKPDTSSTTSSAATSTSAGAASSAANSAHESTSDNHISPNRNKSALNANFLNNGVQMISQSLQKKFSKGVNYNMKIVIKGDYNVGKTSLWLRLQGESFKEQYESSDEIKVANINWNYKLTDDIVKVEIWDVVDRSKKKRTRQQPTQSTQSVGLKLDNNESPALKSTSSVTPAAQANLEPSLDAEFIDVYKNANGCIMVYDITKPWTWDYVERELPKVPAHLPVLVIGNHRDMHHHRTVDELKCKFFLESLNRGSLGSTIRYTETSMRTGFGLAYLYKFFNIPFLQLRRENLMQQLEINAREMDNICEELHHIEEHIDDEYASFSDRLNSQRRREQEENAREVLKNAKSVDEARRVAAEREAAAKAAAELAEQTDPKKLILNQLKSKMLSAQSQTPTPISMSVTIDPTNKAAAILPAAAATNKTQNNVKNSVSLHDIATSKKPPAPLSKSPLDLKFSDAQDDEFNRFLEDKSTNGNQATSILQQNRNDVEENDNEDKNPMVAAFKETLDSSDEEMNKLNKKLSTIPASFDNNEEPDEEQDKQENNIYNQEESSSELANPIIPNLASVDQISLMDKQATQTQIHLNNEDFAFLESLSSPMKPAAEVEKENGTTKKKSSKAKSSRSSKESKADETTTITGKKKSSKKSSNRFSETESIDSKASSSKKKSHKPKAKSTKTPTNSYYQDEDENSNNVYIKKDIDYEEL